MIAQHDTVALTNVPAGQLSAAVEHTCEEQYLLGFELLAMTSTKPARIVESQGFAGDTYYDADVLMVFRKVSG